MDVCCAWTRVWLRLTQSLLSLHPRQRFFFVFRDFPTLDPFPTTLYHSCFHDIVVFKPTTPLLGLSQVGSSSAPKELLSLPPLLPAPGARRRPGGPAVPRGAEVPHAAGHEEGTLAGTRMVWDSLFNKRRWTRWALTNKDGPTLNKTMRSRESWLKNSQWPNWHGLLH